MSRAGRRTQDEGSVLVEFVLVSILVVILALGVIQLAVALHVRNIMTSAASEGATLAAAHDRSLAEGEDRARDLLLAELGSYPVEVSGDAAIVDGTPAIEISVSGPVPLFGLWGVGRISVDAHALKEIDRG